MRPWYPILPEYPVSGITQKTDMPCAACAKPLSARIALQRHHCASNAKQSPQNRF
jgi:hypothetical protein